jgi:hypothetical protein
MKYFAQVYPVGERPEIRGDGPCFDDPRAAWAWLKLARIQRESQFPDWNVGEYTDTVQYLDYAAGTEEFGEGRCEFGDPHEDWPLAADGTGIIVAATPGIGEHAWEDGVPDAGVAYAVVAR